MCDNPSYEELPDLSENDDNSKLVQVRKNLSKLLKDKMQRCRQNFEVTIQGT